MQKRKLGLTGYEIAPLILGGNVFGWTIDEKQSFQLLDAFAGEGFNAIDTANSYSSWVPGHTGGESETIIGNWMKDRKNRDKMVIITKVGMTMGDGGSGLKKDYILKEVEDSLRRLQTDYIDIYLAHQDDLSTPLEETLSAFDQLVKQGKVRSIGASNYTASRLSRSLAISREKVLAEYQVLQPGYNLYDRAEFEGDLENLCTQEKIAVITYFSLAAGFLTGKYRSEKDVSKSHRGEGVKARYLNDKGLQILKALDDLSKQTDATLTQLSLAWLLHRSSVTAPIVSATRLEQLQDILAAINVKLTQEQIKTLG